MLIMLLSMWNRSYLKWCWLSWWNVFGLRHRGTTGAVWWITGLWKHEGPKHRTECPKLKVGKGVCESVCVCVWLCSLIPTLAQRHGVKASSYCSCDSAKFCPWLAHPGWPSNGPNQVLWTQTHIRSHTQTHTHIKTKVSSGWVFILVSNDDVQLS